VTRISGRRSRRGARVVASMIAGMLTACAREAAGRDARELDSAAELCEQFLYSALRGLDAELMDGVDRAASI